MRTHWATGGTIMMQPTPPEPRQPGDRVTRVYFSCRPAQTALQRLRADDVTMTFLAEVLRVDRSTLYRVLSRDRLRYDTADRIAVALGRHPYELWPEWFSDTEEDAQP